jgi:hypothetical protein
MAAIRVYIRRKLRIGVGAQTTLPVEMISPSSAAMIDHHTDDNDQSTLAPSMTMSVVMDASLPSSPTPAAARHVTCKQDIPRLTLEHSFH